MNTILMLFRYDPGGINPVVALLLNGKTEGQRRQFYYSLARA